MNKQDIAKQIIERQIKIYSVDVAGCPLKDWKDKLHSLSDQELIDTYMYCSCCNEPIFPDLTEEIINSLIEEEDKLDDFLDRCEGLQRAIFIKNGNPIKNK